MIALFPLRAQLNPLQDRPGTDIPSVSEPGSRVKTLQAQRRALSKCAKAELDMSLAVPARFLRCVLRVPSAAVCRLRRVYAVRG